MATTNLKLCDGKSLRQMVEKAHKPKSFTLSKKLSFECSIVVDTKLADKIDMDAVLAEKIFLKTSAAYKECGKSLGQVARAIDLEMAGDLKPEGWAQKEWETRAVKVLEETEAVMLTESRNQIKKWQKVQNDRSKYVIKSAVKVTVGTLNMATATLGSAVAAGGVVASGGAAIPGLIAALYVNVKAAIAIGKVLKRLYNDFDTAEGILIDHITHLNKAYKDDTKGKVAAKEIGKAAVTQFLAVNMKSISNAETALSDYKGKLDGIDVKLSQLGISLNKIIDVQSKLQKEISAIESGLSKKKFKSIRLSSANKKLDKLVTEVNGIITDIPKRMKKIDSGRVLYKTSYKPAIVMLKAQKPGWVQYAEMSLKAGDLALGAGFTDFGAADSVLVLVDSIAGEIDDALAEKLL